MNPTDCTHSKVTPAFDEAAARALLEACTHPAELFGVCTTCTNEVRKRWPRFYGECPDCKTRLLLYASAAHYTYGDW